MTEAVAPGPVCRVMVLANPRLGRLVRNIAEQLRAHLPPTCELAAIEGPAAMTDRARRAVDEGFDRIVVAGGDGTVGHILRALVERPVAIGIIPLGTYNNFASSLGIPMDLAAACKVAVEGVPIPVDLGRVIARQPPTTFIFKEVVGVGVDAMAFGGGLDVPGRFKIPVGALSTLSAIVSFRPHPIHFRHDGQKRIKCTQLIVANTPRMGPAVPVVPEATPTDGAFHVMARTWRGRFDLLRELPQIFEGRHRDLEHDICVQARRVEIKGSGNILMHADGEFFCRLPATVEIMPNAVRIVVPAEIVDSGAIQV